MIPTEEEKQKIQEAQLANPDVPLGSAEQFLLTLSSISELSARLQLWAFKMDYEATEKVYTNSNSAFGDETVRRRSGFGFKQEQTRCKTDRTCVPQVWVNVQSMCAPLPSLCFSTNIRRAAT